MVSQYLPHDGDWPHQTFAVTESVRLINEGEKSFCITSSTGGGKSKIAQRLCELFINDGLKAVVMSNRILLTTQLLRGLEKSGIRAGCRAAGFEAWTDLDAPVQVISAPTEISRVIKRREQAVERSSTVQEAENEYSLHQADLIIIDEAHLNKGKRTKQIISEYRQKFGAVVCGITATPLGISDIYDQLIIAGNNSQLRACGALVAAKCFEPAVIDLPKVRKSKTGVFSQKELEDETKAIWSQHVVGHIYDSWKEFNPDARPSLGMAPGVKESLWMAKEYWRRGVNAAHIDAEGIFVDGEYKRTNEQKDRDELFAMAKDGRVKQIWNRYVLREGVDLPWLYMLSLATPIASLLSYLQVVGRILRASLDTDKKFAVIADHCGSMVMHGSPNLDRDQDWLQYFHELDVEKITKDRQQKLTDPENKEPEPITCPNCKMIRKSGNKCPNCNHEHQKSVRMVIQESGKLVPVIGDRYPTRKVSQYNDTEKKWNKALWQMKNAKKPMTFNQAIAQFYRTNKYWPPPGLPGMPRNSADLSRKIKDVDWKDCHQSKK